MVKRKISFGNYKEQEWDEYTGDDPRPGMWLNAVCNRAKYDEAEDQVVFYLTVVDHPDFSGWTRGWYADLDEDSERYWKTHEIIRALQGGSTKDVEVDFENERALAAWLKKCKKIRLQTQDYNDKITIRKVRPLMEAVEGGKSPAKATGAKAAPKAAPAPEPEPEDDDLEPYTEAELQELEVDELEEILKDEFEVPEDEMPEMTARQKRADKDGSKYKALLIETILEEQEKEEGEGEGEPEGQDGEFDEGFADDPEPEPEPEPAPRARRSRAAAAKTEPEPAPTRTRRSRR